LGPVIGILKKISKSAILYGSCARGEYDAASDLDLFIMSHEPVAVREAISRFKYGRKIQAVIKTPFEMAGFKEKEKLYYSEVSRGIIIWEERDEH
jgi:predicted nucleotidyltransferase